MGSCSKRHFLLTVCVLQLIFTLQRQVFDFLGYMWAPILFNFFNIIFVIFGFFGGYQYRQKYIVTYSIWNLLWLAWNIFVICFYLSVGVLDKDGSILNLGTGSISWWEANGPGCKAVFSPEEIDPARQYRAISITDCMLQYEYVEIGQASWHCLLACLGFVGGVCLCRIFIEEDDSFDFMAGDGKSPRHLALQPMYVSYTSLTQSSKRNSLSSIRRNQKTEPKLQAGHAYRNNMHSGHTLDSTNRGNLSSNSINSMNLILPPTVSYRKVYQNSDQPHEQRSYLANNFDSCEISFVPKMDSHNRSKNKMIRADQIRAAQVDFSDYNISRSKSHERLSRRMKNNDVGSNNVRPKSLYARTSFIDS